MLKPFVCGSFHHEDLDDGIWSAPQSPRRNHSCRRTYKDCKNPYSDRGRDKFYMLLEDLQERRQKIYEQMGSHDTFFVRFVHSSTKGWVPVVVKFRDHKQAKPKLVDDDNNKVKAEKHHSEALDKPAMESAVVAPKEAQQPPSVSEEKIIKKSFSSNMMKMSRWRRPSYYLPIVIILILLCLVIFGRSVAILCTSVGWYLVPNVSHVTAKSSVNDFRRSMKKKDYKRKLSDRKMVTDGSLSPKSKKH